MKVGLYFGSYNPLHIGHLIIADAMLQHCPLDEIWLVVSPQNPFKERDGLLEDRLRLSLVEKAVEGNPRIRVCDIELTLPLPSYTYNTLQKLSEKYPQHEFCLIMGSDNVDRLDRWRNATEILEHYDIYVYPRPNHLDAPLLQHSHVHLIPNLPHMEISSTYIRQQISEGRSVRYLVPDAARKEIEDKGYYRW